MTDRPHETGVPIDAEPTPGPDHSPLSATQVEAWRTQGAVLVDGLVALDAVAAIRAAALAEVAQHDVADQPQDFGSGGSFTFPSECHALNDVTLSPRLLGGVAQLLGCTVRDLRLTQSDAWAKRGREVPVDDPADRPLDNADQRMHVDYPNHTLLHPPRWDRPDAVEVIVYADDVDDCGGATSVVLRDGPDDPAYPWPVVDLPGVAGHPWINDRRSAEEQLAATAPQVAAWRAEHLYPRERAVRFRPGTALLYRHDTWHRGTPIRPGAVRVVQNLTFRLATSTWMTPLHPSWSWAAYRPTATVERLVATASADQRCVLGIPAPGDPYWTTDTLHAMDARYGHLGIDLTEYRRYLP